MNRMLLGVALVAVVAATVVAQKQRPTVYIQPTEDGFETYLAAAITKKKVPITVMTSPEGVTYTLKATAIEEHVVSTGHKVVNCLFAYCGGNENKANTSVQLVDSKGAVAWSYSVNKGRGQKNRQSMAEAIAKHLNDDFLKISAAAR